MESADVDLGTTPEADPLADVPAEEDFDMGDALPPGIEQGELGGDNPSEIPAEGEYMADPEAGEDAEPFVEPEPQQPELPPEPPLHDPEPLPEPLPEAPPPPEAEPLPEAPLPEDPPPPPEPAEVPPPPPEPAPEVPREEQSVPATSVAGTAANPEPKKPKRGRPKGSKNKKPAGEGPRRYVPFVCQEEFDPEDAKAVLALSKLAASGKLWVIHDPVEAGSAEAALRATYRVVAEKEEATIEIGPVSEKSWKPQRVTGRRVDQFAIKIGE